MFTSCLITALSDCIIIIAQIKFLASVHKFKINKMRTASAIAVTIILNIICTYGFFGDSLFIQTVTISINSIKNFALCHMVHKYFSIKSLLIVMNIQMVCSVIASGIYTLLNFPPEYTLIHYQIILLIIRTSVLVFINIFFKENTNKKLYNTLSVIPSAIYILILFCIFIEDGLIEVLNYRTHQYEIKVDMIKKLFFVLIICLTILIISLIFNVIYRSYDKITSEFLEKQVEMQLSHYSKTERLNIELRKFRHDYNNHINCLNAMLKAHKYADAENYIQNLSDIIPVADYLFKTGNYVADAILSDKKEVCLKNGIELTFEGFITSMLNNTDLCIVLSNALDNAIEACIKYQGKRSISVYGNCQQGYYILIIKNTCSVSSDTTADIYKTSKSDKLNHGFGLINIDTVVQKYTGTTKTFIENNVFTLCLTFNSIPHKTS